MTTEEYLEIIDNMSDKDIVECFYGGDYHYLVEDNPFIFENLKRIYKEHPEAYKADVEAWRKGLPK